MLSLRFAGHYNVHSMMLRASAALCFVLAASLAHSVPVPVFDQPNNYTSTGFFSDGEGNQIADEFTLGANARIVQINWFGYSTTFPGPILVDTVPRPFTVRFYSDTGAGLPATSAFFEATAPVAGVRAGC